MADSGSMRIRNATVQLLGRYAPYVRGALPYTPLQRVLMRGTGGTDNARYCYSVFHRHLAEAALSGLKTIPRVVAELGPGDSLGVGLAWLLAGSERYLGFDVRHYASYAENVRVFDELVELFASRAEPPTNEEFPEMKPPLRDSANTLRRQITAIDETKVNRIRQSLHDLTGNSDGPVSYVAPWNDPSLVAPNSVDLIFSQAVLEHVVDLEGVMDACHQWIRPGGWMSHQIDLRSHGHAPTWDGHRAYSDRQWRMIEGRRPYLINRRPDVDHIDAVESQGFDIVNTIRAYSKPTVTPHEYAPRFQGLTEESCRTSGLFVQAVLTATG